MLSFVQCFPAQVVDAKYPAFKSFVRVGSSRRFNPSSSICWGRERLSEILNFVNDLPILELHDADGLKGVPA
jgi:hypothetical protein